MDIAYIDKSQIAGWRAACEQVAAEKTYLGLVSLLPFDPERALPNRMIANNWPMYCALDNGRVVGWIDIIPNEVPECAHRGTLGLGLLASHRGQGAGSRLMEAALAHAPQCGLTKVELAVYTSNLSAISLFLKFGFSEAGMWRDYRRLDGVTYDALLMERFLG
nr:GNAT family N-acetyltransferase [uncultured Hyphomonas sp.]